MTFDSFAQQNGWFALAGPACSPGSFPHLLNAAVPQRDDLLAVRKACPSQNGLRTSLIYIQAYRNLHASKPAHVSFSQQPSGDQILQGDRFWYRRTLSLQTVSVGLCSRYELLCIHMTGMTTGSGEVEYAPRYNHKREHRYG